MTPEAVQSPLERLTHVNLDSILENKVHEVDKYVDDAETDTTIVEKHEVEHDEAPSQPSIVSHSVKVDDAVNDFDAAKASTEAMMDGQFGPNTDDDYSQDFE